MSSETPFRLAILALVASGCSYDENLPNADLKGTVRIPKAVAEVTMADNEGNTWTIDASPTSLGPVYIGVYAGIDDTLFSYPHPEWGPVLDPDVGGDAYPYGGASAGRFAWGCYQATVCKTLSGRYETYEEVINFHRDQVRVPITDDQGREITSAIEYQERCFEMEDITADFEMDLIGPLNFTDTGDYLEAEVDILRTQYEEGVSIWGFADMPSPNFSFSTCDASAGDYQSYYDERYYKGTNYRDVLNFPGNYISEGDLISDDPWEVVNPDEEFVLELGYKNED